MSDKRAETQDDRCSVQLHLWRRQRWLGHDEVMACRCGAVHPVDRERLGLGQ